MKPIAVHTGLDRAGFLSLPSHYRSVSLMTLDLPPPAGPETLRQNNLLINLGLKLRSTFLSNKFYSIIITSLTKCLIFNVNHDLFHRNPGCVY